MCTTLWASVTLAASSRGRCLWHIPMRVRPHRTALQPTQLARPKTHLLGPRALENISDHRMPVCRHPAPGIRHLGKAVLPLAKVKVPPSQNTGQHQQEGVGEGRPRLAQGGGVQSCPPLWPPLAGNRVLAEKHGTGIWGLCPLGSSRPPGD